MASENESIGSWLELTSAVRKLSMPARKRFAELYSANSRYATALYEISGRRYAFVGSLQEEIDTMRRRARAAINNELDDEDIDGDF